MNKYNRLKTRINSIDTYNPQSLLDDISGSMINVFGNHVWMFKSPHGHIINIDFNDLLFMEEKYPDWSIASDFDWVFITKISWLSLASLTTPSVYQARLNGLKLFWSALANLCETQLTIENSADVMSFMLMNNAWSGETVELQKIKSYTSFNFHFQIIDWKNIFTEIGFDIISRNVTKPKIYKKIQELVPVLTREEVTYRDWIGGGSLDLLTLDHGRYYVEHCFSFYEEYYPLAFALSSIYRGYQKIADSLELSIKTVIKVVPLILQGDSLQEIKHKQSGTGLKSIKKIYEYTVSKFEIEYKKAKYETFLQNDSAVKSIVSACGLKITNENIDRLKVITWEWINRKDKVETERLLGECVPRVAWGDFENKLCAIKNRIDSDSVSIPTEEDYLSIGVVKKKLQSPSNKYYRQLVKLVEAAGLINVIALTGWRQGEYSFPLSSIKKFRNSDKLDQYAFPWRCQVDWYVYKTNANVRELREITFSTFMFSEKLNKLLRATGNKPCLYAITDKKINPEESGTIVCKLVRVPWGHFVNNYSGFKEIDNYESFLRLQAAINNGKALSIVERKELERLLKLHSHKEWLELSIDRNLRETWVKVRKELPLVELFFMGSNHKDKKNWLFRYKEGTLRPDWIDLLDTHLSQEVKSWIQFLPENQLYSVHAITSVLGCLMENIVYPSPHAFRHMWAESVYRRFDGDAGWMIRSQFKHISRTMWLAYIRNKDNRRMHEQVKIKVISSLVNNYILHKGDGYTGQFHTWLRRVLKKIKLKTPQEQRKYATQLKNREIINIKANPWGYCLLKRRTKGKAKCAEMGEPMRHNASPDLCLGCNHNLMQVENLEWSLLHVMSHAEALKNPIVPAIFKESSYELVKNVFQHVRTMNPNHAAMQELQEILESYKSVRSV